MRYTEARLARITTELLGDIDKETVDWQPNYDASREEPTVLPSKFPNLLVNGSDGIAVGMATNIRPTTYGEVGDAPASLPRRNPEATVEDLRRFIKGPDYPTGGTIWGAKGDPRCVPAPGRSSRTPRAGRPSRRRDGPPP